MKFCCDCGHRVELQLTPGDDHPRFQCRHCQRIHYQNPKILVSCYATWGEKVLWIKRGTEPNIGQWAAPSGFLEENETLTEAAARELFEETRARVDISKMALHMIGNLTTMNQVYMVFHAPLLAPEFSTTHEAQEVALLSSEEFPASEFAFPEVLANVELFYRDLQNKKFDVYMGTLVDGINHVRKNLPSEGR